MSRFEILAECVKIAAIVIGVGVGFSEFVLKDRAHDRLKATYTQEFIKLSLDASIIDATQDFVETAFGDFSITGQINRADAIQMQKAFVPMLREFLAWETCFSADLCDQDIGLKFVCGRAGSLAVLLPHVYASLGVSKDGTNPYFNDLITRCSDYFGAEYTAQFTPEPAL